MLYQKNDRLFGGRNTGEDQGVLDQIFTFKLFGGGLFVKIHFYRFINPVIGISQLLFLCLP